MNIMIILICASCLFYQVALILQQYLNNDVVTNIQFVKNHADIMPGITICYDKIFSFEKIAQRYNEHGDIYSNYSKFMETFKNMDINDEKLNYEQNSKYFDYYAKLNRFYLENLRIRSEKLAEFSSYKDIVENLSIPLQQYIFNSKIQIIDFEIDDGTRISRLPSILSMAKPIESLFFSPRHKCFTFFSHLQSSSSSSSRRLKLIIKKISIVIYSGWQTIPYSSHNTVYLAIHSPNIMPNIDSFIPINITSRIDLVYTKFQYDQLPNFSGCTHYLETNSRFKSQSDCIFDCQKRYYSFDCIAEFYYDQEFPIRSEQLPSQSSNTTCDWPGLSNLHYYEMREKCMAQCPDECGHVYYLLQFKEKKLFKLMISTSNSINVYLIQSNFPTIIIKQLPEMSLISLLCNIGGLLGMWLGVSLLSTFNNLYNTSKNIFWKLISKINFYNFHNNTSLFIVNNNNNVMFNIQ